MPRAKKTTTTKKSTTKKRAPRKTARRKTTDRRKNIVGNFRGKEDVFWTKVVKGFEKFLESPFK